MKLCGRADGAVLRTVITGSSTVGAVEGWRVVAGQPRSAGLAVATLQLGGSVLTQVCSDTRENLGSISMKQFGVGRAEIILPELPSTPAIVSVVDTRSARGGAVPLTAVLIWWRYALCR